MVERPAGNLKVLTSFETLMELAHTEGQIRKALKRLERYGADAQVAALREKLQAAVEAHENYRQLCLQSDGMLTGFRVGDL